MPRSPRVLLPNSTYHITVRCNNRRFDLKRPYCREILLQALQQAKSKYAFKLYAVCLMSNHVHYLLEPADPADLPRLMHWLNWYTAMSFNRMLKRSGHFWEQRYYSSAFDSNDDQRVLNTLRTIHANPKTAGLSTGLHYGYSNYATYADLSDDGLTEWHPAFLRLADSSDECAARYRRFCLGYAPQPKAGGRSSNWGRIALPDGSEQERKHKKARSPKGTGQMVLPLTPKPCQGWNSENIQKTTPALLKTAQETARRFVRANCAHLWA